MPTGGSSGPRRALPTFVVIGAQKCGTSALHAYLARHPQVSMSSPKELDFFVAGRNWRRDVDWYVSHFDPRRPARGESSPNYTAHPQVPGVPARMAAVLPEARLVYLVRDPVVRIAAQWVHNVAARRDHGTLADALRSERLTYLARSRYMFQLDHYLDHYPRERILVLDQAELRSQAAVVLERVFRFLGVDPAAGPDAAVEAHATSAKRRPSAPTAWVERRLQRSPLRGAVPAGAVLRLEARMVRRPQLDRPDVAVALSDDLLDLLREDAVRLRRFTGLALDDWSV